MTATVPELLQQQFLAAGGLQDALATLAGDDPQLSLLLQVLTQRAQEQEDVREAEQVPDEHSALRRHEEDIARELDVHRSVLTEQRRATLRARWEAVTTELDERRALLDRLAAALGACPDCWGEHSGCRWCRGRGRPGSMQPDPEEFHHYVMPVLKDRTRARDRTRAVPRDLAVDQTPQGRSTS